MHKLDTQSALHVESEDADELFAADACEGQTQTLHSEECFTLANLLDEELVDLVIELDCVESTLWPLAIDELQLRVGLACLD